jgi:hypothetical protein
MTEGQALQSMPSFLPPSDGRMLLRFLSRLGLLQRHFVLAESLPEPPSLFSQLLTPSALRARPAALCALDAALQSQHSVGQAVELWETSETLLVQQQQLQAGAEAAAAADSSSSSSTALRLARMLEACPASPCPLPGLITSYSLHPQFLLRLACLCDLLGALPS